MSEVRTGVYYATAAYAFWGFAPLYFVLVEFVAPTEIIVHRVFWSVLLLFGILYVRGAMGGLAKLPLKHFLLLALSGLLLALNWWVFVWALQQGRVMETSVGYYINPLVTVLLGVLVLGERLRPLQWLAMLAAAAGVANEIANVGVFPVVALTLAFTFGFYGLVRKRLGLDPVLGLAVESLLMLPIAAGILLWLAETGTMHGFDRGGLGLFYLALAGVVTCFPLLCFTAAANRLPLLMLGMFQYLAPSITLVLAVTYYGEPFSLQKIVTFCCIWLGLMIFTAEGLYHHRGLKNGLVS